MTETRYGLASLGCTPLAEVDCFHYPYQLNTGHVSRYERNLSKTQVGGSSHTGIIMFTLAYMLQTTGTIIIVLRNSKFEPITKGLAG
jgi:hypothetical protein